MKEHIESQNITYLKTGLIMENFLTFRTAKWDVELVRTKSITAMNLICMQKEIAKKKEEVSFIIRIHEFT